MISLVKRTWRMRHFALYMIIGQLKGFAAVQLLGYAWWILEPLALTVTYTFVIRGVFQRGGPDLPVLILMGMLPWRWTSNAIAEGISSIRRSSGLVHAGYLPKTIFPLVSLGTGGVRFLVAFLAVTLALGLFTPYVVGANLWALPLAMLLQLLFNLGMALVFSHFGAYSHDTANIWNIFGRVWFYFSPIMYERPMLNGIWQVVYDLNPMVAVVAVYRWAVMGHSLPTPGNMVSLAVFTVGSLLWGAYLHNKHDLHYAKVI